MNTSPPGLHLTAFSLDAPVTTCSEAAAAKQIPLSNELKTLILLTESGPYAVHVRGDRRVSLRRVKSFLGSEQASMASLEYLKSMGLEPGTVCPVLDPVWKLPHLISSSVLPLDFVSTNNRTRSRFFRFPPQLLLQAQRAFVGDFEQ